MVLRANTTDGPDLHDARLIAVHVDWKDGMCVVDIAHGTLGHCTLRFSAVSHVTLPRTQPWGPAVSINALRQPGPCHYEIDMQSGDVIDIRARDVFFVAGSEYPSA